MTLRSTTPTTPRILAVLGLLLTACPGSDGGDGDAGTAGGSATLEFRGEQAFLPGLDLDTGWLPEGSPASVRATMTANGQLTVEASATSDGTTLEPVAATGELSVGGTLSLEVSARLDVSGIEYEGVVDSFDYTVETSTASFEPFSIGADVTVTADLPAQVLGEVPIPSVPGATLKLEVTGGDLTSVFSGVCAEAGDGLGQYTGATTVDGVVACAATIVVEVPLLGAQTFGPFAFDVPIPSTTSALDLGVLSLSDGAAVMGPGPCTGMSASGDDGSGAGTSGGSGDPSGDGDTSSDPTTADDSGDGAADSTGDDETGSDPTDGDPNYPPIDADGCPPGFSGVGVGDTPPNGLCLPPCGSEGTCPSGATGSATGVCGFNPDTSYLACTDESDCLAGEFCVEGTCFADPTHCVLLCDEGTCPDAMTCIADACTYLD